ncbi:MAG: hypothetical protein LBB41_00690 [Prevotellaceae bacterium]|jgi:hypothetical protein|nr:hypothetical protein [Prevotellaceae bacterium]
MKNLVKFSTLMLCVALVFVGCKKDEPTETEDYASKIAGQYNGEFVMYEIPVGDAILVVTKVANDKVQIATTAPGVGDVNCNATVGKSGNNYSISGKTSITMEDMPQPFDVAITGTITEEGAANLKIGVTTANTPFAEVNFAGQKATVE